VTVEGVLEHRAAFQAISDANGGNRAAGPPGYTALRDCILQCRSRHYRLTPVTEDGP
jgi:hypothetical protein